MDGSDTTRRIGEFEIIDEIGRGGMGIVYRARQVPLAREVALKVLPGAAFRIGPSLRRFRAEARAVARLNHPNVVSVYSQGEVETHYYYAMALVEGCSLDIAMHQKPELLSSTWIRRALSPDDLESLRFSSKTTAAASGGDTTDERELPPPRTPDDFVHLARLMADVADGLAHAHHHGVIHRDIKPQNLLLSDDGRIYITDFGLATLTDETNFTATGDLLGTPAYLSPEQIQGGAKTIDHRTDVYSFGVTLYELLTSRRPFGGATRAEIVTRICTTEPALPRWVDRRIPKDLETICLRAMDKNPAQRYPYADLLADDLRRFADGLPIRSRRPSLFRQGARLLWRRRAVAGSTVLLLITLAIGAGYLASRAAAREKEADRLLRVAYDQLVYLDYQTPTLVEHEINKAQTLGADASRLHLVRALATLGAGENAKAVEHLQSVLNAAPDSLAALYLLSWAQWRKRDPQSARITFERAESLGGPDQAEEWFFRGLAAHFDRPNVAIESYEKANDLRASQGQFFPQSVLHLARAYNQQMYSTRSLDSVEDARAILSQLIKRKHYGAYPHYLLSITQRLEGEILQASADANDQGRAADSFHAALQSAVLGQGVDPHDDRPITAEAECLERLERFPEAIEARTRAIAVATQDLKRCEGHHYRWRLHYWIGDWDAALKDIETHAACLPQSLFYARIYPLVVYAEMGDLQRALREARAIAQDGPDDFMAVIWSATCLRLLGQVDEAAELLSRDADEVGVHTPLVPPQTAEWLAALYECTSGRRELDDLLALADDLGESRKLRAEAHFHVAMKDLAEGRRDQAVLHFTEAYLSFDNELRYTFHAKVLLVKLRSAPDWPAWLGMGDKHSPPP